MRFYMSYTNRRDKTYGAGMAEGNSTHTRGWNAGVRVVVMVNDAGQDTFAVYATTGSNGHGRDTLIGTVCDTADGPAFVPEGK